MTHRFIRTLAHAASVVAACAAAPASPAADSFETRAAQGSHHRYEIRTRFAPAMHDPERGDNNTVVDCTLEAALFVTYTDGRRRVLRMQIEAIELQYLDNGGGAIVGLGFDSDDPPSTDARNPAGSLRSFVGKTFDLVSDSDGRIADLRDVVWPLLPEDEIGNILRRLVSEGMLATSVEWIFGLPPAAELDAGDSFDDTVIVRFPGDGEVAFHPRFTYAGRDGDLARFDIAGDAEFTAKQPPVAVVTGVPVMDIETYTLEGEALWRLDLGVLESLTLTADARIEPANIDPLGRRIDRRSIGERFEIRRLSEPQDAQR